MTKRNTANGKGLSLRRVIAAAMPDLQIFGVPIYQPDFQLAEGAVGGFVLRLISKQVLLAQVLLQLREGVFQIASAFREYGASPCLFSEFFERAFVDSALSGIPDADRIDYDFGA